MHDNDTHWRQGKTIRKATGSIHNSVYTEWKINMRISTDANICRILIGDYGEIMRSQ